MDIFDISLHHRLFRGIAVVARRSTAAGSFASELRAVYLRTSCYAVHFVNKSQLAALWTKGPRYGQLFKKKSRLIKPALVSI